MDSDIVYIGLLQVENGKVENIENSVIEAGKKYDVNCKLQVYKDEQEFQKSSDLEKPCDFLIVGMEKGKVDRILESFLDSQKTELGLRLDVKGGMRRVPLKDIYYFEILGRKVKAVVKDEIIESSDTITDLEERLAGRGFVKSHKSFLVNLEHVRTLKNGELELSNKEKVPVSKRKMKEVRQALLEFSKEN